MEPNYYIAECRHGRGLFSARRFSKGETILTFHGREISFAEAVAKGDRESDPMQIGDELYLDIDFPGVLVNHSCEPNCGIDSAMAPWSLVAINEIEPDTEFLYDYSTTMNEKYWTMKCDCQSDRCRRIVGDFCDLPPETIQRYTELCIVPNFILSILRNSQDQDQKIAKAG